jgi:glycine cleavage system transcriptional repressor
VPLLAVTALGADRPGIIARVTGVLLEHGGNLADSTMTILGGQFAIVLLVDTDAEAAALETDLAAATADLGLVVAVRPVGPGAASAAPTHMLSVYGADRPGIVHAVATALAERSVNVTDLTTRVLEGDQPVYAMVLEISLPEDLEPEELTAVLRRQGTAEAVEASIHPLDVTTF